MQCQARAIQFGYSPRKGEAVVVKPLRRQQPRTKQGASNTAMRPILPFPSGCRLMRRLLRCRACQGGYHWLRPPLCIHLHRASNASRRIIGNRL